MIINQRKRLNNKFSKYPELSTVIDSPTCYVSSLNKKSMISFVIVKERTKCQLITTW